MEIQLNGFGLFFNQVCADLIHNHEWNISFSQEADTKGELLDIIHKGFHRGDTSETTAKLVHQAWLKVSREES